MDRQVDKIEERVPHDAVEPKLDPPARRQSISRFLSHDSGPFAQFVKYGAIGVASTLVQMSIFYLLASTCLKCLTADDKAVLWFGLPSAAFTGEEAWYASRGMLAAAATGVGFVFANIFCWLMNRWFVFRPGKFKWYVEFGTFFGVSAVATFIALGIMKWLIDQLGCMPSLAHLIEVVVSFLVNFFIRKYFIFKG